MSNLRRHHLPHRSVKFGIKNSLPVGVNEWRDGSREGTGQGVVHSTKKDFGGILHMDYHGEEKVDEEMKGAQVENVGDSESIFYVEIAEVLSCLMCAA